MSQRTEQFSCECGKQFGNRGDLEKHRQNCATAQAGSATGSTQPTQRSSTGGQVRTAGSGSPGSTNE